MPRQRQNFLNLQLSIAAVAQLVEHQLPKLRVVGSSPICRSGSCTMCGTAFFCICKQSFLPEAVNKR